jgi:hypothetical protein
MTSTKEISKCFSHDQADKALKNSTVWNWYSLQKRWK